MKFVKTFDELGKDDANIAGGKGASLGEMTNAGIPVPPGYVILANAFDRFCRETDLTQEIAAILKTVNTEATHTVEKASQDIQSLILSRDIPSDIADEIRSAFGNLDTEFVAVRSSATAEDGADHAWAGQLDSFLNTTSDTLLDNVRHCWASLFTPRAIFYRIEKNLHDTFISVAVVVQKMVNSEKSGIAFSVHPVTEDYNQLIIEAGFGLGEAIVSGSVTPDSYVVTKKPKEIIDVNVSEQSRALQRKEEGGNQWIDLGDKGIGQVLSTEQILELSELIIKIENHYGFPCDIEWAMEDNEFYIVQSRPITTLGGQIKKAEKNIGLYTLGNQDVDTSFLTLEMTWKGMRDPRIQDQIGLPTPDSFEEIISGTTINTFVVANDIVNFVNRAAERLINDEALLNDLKENTIISAKKIRDFGRDSYKKFDSFSNDQLSDLILEAKELQAECVAYGTVVAFADIFGTISDKLIEIVNKRENLKYPIHVYTNILGSPAESSLTELAYEDVRASDKSDEELLQEYYWLDQGYIGRGLTLKDIEVIRSHKSENEEQYSRTELLNELDLTAEEEYVFNLSQTIIYMKSLRADSRQFIHVFLNKIVDKLSQEWNVESRLIETMYAEEIYDVSKGKIGLPTTLESRFAYSVMIPEGKGYIENVAEVASLFISKNVLEEEIDEKDTIVGQTAQPGKVKGNIKLVFGPQHNGKIQEGDILVSTATSPQLLPAMKKAAAFITDVGGITSHAAIVARELKKPCIVGTKIATKILKDGDLVEVDADSGVVRIL